MRFVEVTLGRAALFSAACLLAGCTQGALTSPGDAGSDTSETSASDVAASDDVAVSTDDTGTTGGEDTGSGSEADASGPDASAPGFDDVFGDAPAGIFTNEVCEQVRRIAGATRFETSALISQGIAPGGAASAVVASASDTAAGGSPAAGLSAFRDSPLLLTAQDTLPGATRAELQRLGAQTVYLIGGTAVVSQAVEDDIAALGISIDRLAGTTRFSTAVDVASAAGFASTKAFVTSGDNDSLVDSVTAASVAGALGWPLLFVAADAVPQETADGLVSFGITETIVVGGSAAISDGVLAELPNPTRVAGTSRLATSSAVATEGVNRGVDARQVFLVKATGLGDSLSAAAVERPVLLTTPESLDADAAGFIQNNDVANVVLVGGVGALSAQVEQDVCNLF